MKHFIKLKNIVVIIQLEVLIKLLTISFKYIHDVIDQLFL